MQKCLHSLRNFKNLQENTIFKLYDSFDRVVMEKLLNHRDRECMKMAMLKHEETFREQVYELHRLYQIQKMLMKEIAKKARSDPRYCNKLDDKQSFLDLERPAEEFNCPVGEDDQTELELTLGSRSYHKRKIKASEQAFPADSGLSFSSSSTRSSHTKGTSEDILCLSNQDRLKSPPWLFQALSLNMT